MPLYFALICLTTVVASNVVPAYSDYKDTIALLDKMQTEDLIEILKDLLYEKMLEEKSDKAIDSYNENILVDRVPILERKILNTHHSKSLDRIIQTWLKHFLHFQLFQDLRVKGYSGTRQEKKRQTGKKFEQGFKNKQTKSASIIIG